jgi:hypothetical protein
MKRLNAPQLNLVAALTAAMIASYSTSALAVDHQTNLLWPNPRNFSHPLVIDNKWLPTKPGTQMTYEGQTINDEGKPEPWGVIQVVTDLVKNINGIDTVVVWDRDYENGRLTESETYFRAQDDQGNVWHFGEVKEVYDEDNKMIGAKTWMEGRLGARAGIMITGAPAAGTPSVSEGLALGVYKWDDRHQVRKFGEKVTVPAGAYDNVLVVEEWSEPELRKGALQLKYYAPNVGYVFVGWEGNDPTKETLGLAKITQLDAQEMERVRAEVLELENRSWLYGRQTRPLRRRGE